MKRIICIMAALTALMLLLSGCAGAPKYSSSEYSAAYDNGSDMAEAEYYAYDTPAEAPAPAAEAAAGETVYTAGIGTEDDASLSSPEYGGRKVIRSVSISLETDTFDDNLDALLKKVNEVGGYVESSNVDGRKPEVYNDPGRHGYFTFRIPVDRVDKFVADAKGCGTLTSAYENAEDITSQYFDMETRLSVLRTQLDRLTSILVKTDNLADIIQLESEIARVTLEIEELTTQLRRYDGLVDYATVSVSLQELRLSQGPAAEKTVGQRIGEDFNDSLYGVGTFIVNAFVWIVGALPVLLFIAAIAAGLFFLIFGGKKRREKRKLRRVNRLVKKAQKMGTGLASPECETPSGSGEKVQQSTDNTEDSSNE